MESIDVSLVVPEPQSFERRKHRRYSVAFRAWLRAGKRVYRLQTRDVSGGGAALQLRIPKLAADTEAVFYIEDPEHFELLSVPVRVIQPVSGPTRMEFIDVTDGKLTERIYVLLEGLARRKDESEQEDSLQLGA